MKTASNDNTGIAARCGWQALPREEDQNSDSEDAPGNAKGKEDTKQKPRADAEYVEQRLRELAGFERRYKKRGSS